MIAYFLGSWNSLATAAPCIIAFLLLAVYFNLAPRTSKQSHHKSAFSAATFSIGMALQHLDQIMRPGAQHQIRQMYEEDGQDEAGDPDTPKAQLNRQLKRIRRGEEIDRLILRLK